MPNGIFNSAVSAQDEKKLMDFNMEIYQMAKEMAAMNTEAAPVSE